MKNLGMLCKELEAKGEHEAAALIDRLAEANAELSEENVELLGTIEYLSTRLDDIVDIRIAQDAILRGMR